MLAAGGSQQESQAPARERSRPRSPARERSLAREPSTAAAAATQSETGVTGTLLDSAGEGAPSEVQESVGAQSDESGSLTQPADTVMAKSGAQLEAQEKILIA